MARRSLLYLEDMRESANKVQRYTQGMGLSEFMLNELVVDATLRNLEIIGEAAKNLSDDVKGRYPEIDWRGMGRFRDLLSHHYFGVRLETVWDVVERELPALLIHLDAVLEVERDKLQQANGAELLED